MPPPLYDRDSLIVLGEHVTLEAGTGCVHTAPGHGQDDYQTGLNYGLEIYNPVDDYGRYLPGLELFGGQKVPAANPQVIDKLLEVGALLKDGKVSHSYPHCWRCKKPIIFRATEQWFISMEANDLRGKALKHIDARSVDPELGPRADLRHDREPPRLVHHPPAHLGGADHRLLLHRVRRGAGRRQDHAPCRRPLRRPAAAMSGSTGSARTAPCRHALPNLRGGGIPQGDRHPRCLVRLRGLPRRRARTSCRSSPPRPTCTSKGSDQHRGWFHSSLLETVGTRGTCPLQDGADPRFRARRQGPQDDQVGRQRGRPGGGHQEVRRRDPAPLGGRPGLPRRHPHRRGDPPAGFRGLPPHPQHRPLHPRQPQRFRPGHRHGRPRASCSRSTAGP